MSPTEEGRTAKAFTDRAVERALEMEGTCTGEDGVGQGKKHFMTSEHGSGAVGLMRAIKGAIDPHDEPREDRMTSPGLRIAAMLVAGLAAAVLAYALVKQQAGSPW